VEILFLLVGLVFVAFGAAVVISEVRARRGAWAVPGEVIGFSTGKAGGSGTRSYYAVAEYVGMDGRKRYLEGSVGSSSPLGAVGDAVTILLQPDDPERAVIKSSLTYVLGVALAVMGLASCMAFFAIFRATTFSVLSAVGVVSLATYKLRGSLRDKPMSLQAWREYKDQALRPRLFTDASKAEIPWADRAALETAIAAQRKATRFAVPILLLGGVGLVFLGAHLYRKTGMFLDRALAAPGVVVEMARNDSTHSNTSAPVVEFEHEGKKFRFKDSIGSDPPAYRRGDRVGVLYDPADPRNARIDRGRWNEAVPISIGGFGALLCFLGLSSLRRQKPRTG
jgi:hypothetical protein